MTERENYLMTMAGKQPEWVPNFEDACDMIIPALLGAHLMTEEKRDFFSVPWTINDAGPMVDNHQPPVMEDVTEWKKYVHFPDLDQFDWENTSRAQLEAHDPDKALMVMPNMGGGTIFMPLLNMMGFENALCALLEEPEACMDFFNCVTEFYEACIPYFVKYYHPDAIIVGDDLCTASSAFVSMDYYKRVLKPFYQREIDAVHQCKVLAELHMCGKCEPFVEDFVEMGVTSWQPAQGINDLAGLKKKYGNRLVMNGTWTTSSPAWRPGAPEELVRGEVRKCIDQFAVGGGMMFWTGGQVGTSENQIQLSRWADDEVRKYGREFYRKEQ